MTDPLELPICIPPADSPKFHLGGCVYDGDEVSPKGDIRTWSPVVWRTLLEQVGTYPVRVLDVGCGFGYSTRWFAEQYECRTNSVVGVEGWRMAVQHSVYPNIMLHDLQDGPFLIGEYDLCWCAEFVEHLDEQYLPNLLHTFNLCDTVAMTHAIPGQDGHHHVNEQLPAYWVDKMKTIGYTLDEPESHRLRSLVPPGDEGHYVREGLLIFRRTELDNQLRRTAQHKEQQSHEQQEQEAPQSP